MNIPATRMVPHFGEQIKLRAADLMAYHDDQPAEITIKCIDELIEDSCELEACVADLSAVSVALNKIRMRMASKASSYLKALGRTDYDSPVGSIQIKQKWDIRMPKDDEDKRLLFEYLKERDMFDRLATVNAASFKAFFNADWKAAAKKDPDALVLFTMPGVSQPVLDEHTVIKPNKGVTHQEEDENETYE